jgi:hypothetical protein
VGIGAVDASVSRGASGAGLVDHDFWVGVCVVAVPVFLWVVGLAFNDWLNGVWDRPEWERV